MIEQSEEFKKLGTLIKGIQTAMLTTVDLDGDLRSRPMATLEAGSYEELYFFIDDSSLKTMELQAHHEVNLAYAEPKENKYVSVSGRGEVLHDKEKIASLWKPIMKAWFPMGLEDPDLALLKVEVIKAEYWDAPSSTFVKLIGFAKAIFTGKRENLGEHRKLN